MNIQNDPAMQALLGAYSQAERTSGSKKSNLIDAFLWTIGKGYWQPGDRLPTERQFVDALPVSLGTVQSAFRRLTESGLVVRKAGVGTHVQNASERDGEKWFLRFLNDSGDGLLPSDILHADITETTADGPWQTFLGPRPSFIRINRIISIGGLFSACARVYLDGTLYRPLLDFDLAVIGQLHIRHILQDRFDAPTLSRRTRIRFLRLDAEIAGALDKPAGSNAIALDVSSFTLGELPLCFQRFIIPENEFALDVKGD